MAIIRKGWYSNIIILIVFVIGSAFLQQQPHNSLVGTANAFLVVTNNNSRQSHHRRRHRHRSIIGDTNNGVIRRISLYSSSSTDSTTATTTNIEESSEAVVVVDGDVDVDDGGGVKQDVLKELKRCWLEEGATWARDFVDADMEDEQEACRMLYSIFSSLSSSSSSNESLLLGVNGQPLYLSVSDLPSSIPKGYFSCQDLKLATQQDFLDAQRGSTDNRKGWQVYGVSNPKGSSMEDARMSWEDVCGAMEKGTVIFNSAGAHIPKLASLCLACCDATNLPNAVNLYLTKAQQRTSAPPHTDRQDVVVVQMTGTKRWRVYAPPNPHHKPQSDPFARGKMDDSLPLHTLSTETTLLLDVTLTAGDILFVPAGFPHTTDTILPTTTNTNTNNKEEASLHLTFNLDSHVWDLDYLNLRNYALLRANVPDTALQTSNGNKYTGPVNQLPLQLWQDVMQHLPLSFLLLPDHDDTDTDTDVVVQEVTEQVKRLSQQIDSATYDAVEPSSIWTETVQRVRQQGLELLDVHRDMYLAAMDEGRLRRTEGTNHNNARAMDMQRLSIFRVDKYYKQVDVYKQQLMDWANANNNNNNNNNNDANQLAADTTTTTGSSLPDDWPTTHPLVSGDAVEADLGGAMFPATVTSPMNNNNYKVTFFDGDVDILPRDMIRLVTPPKITNDNDDDEQPPPGLTKKELKRWRKKMEKKKR